MVIRILLLTLLAMLAGSLWLGYEKGPFKEIHFSLPAASRQALPPRIEIPALHQYRNGAHAYAGEITVPSSCDRIDAQSIVRESYPEQVSIELSTVPREENSICVASSTVKRFKVAFEASAEAHISVTLNKKPATFVITEATSSVNVEALPID